MRRRIFPLAFLSTFLVAVLAGCGGDEHERAAREAQRHAEEIRHQAEDIRREAHETARRAREQAREARDRSRDAEDLAADLEDIVENALDETRRALTGGRDVDPVDASTLHALLPERLDGMDRVDFSSEREGAMGFFVTTATAEYEGDDGSVEIALVDIGGIASPARLGFPWAEHSVDRETENTYERTVDFKGYRAHEKYDRRRDAGEMAVIVADRFVVAVEGDGVPMTSIKDALNLVDLDALEDLRDAGLRAEE